MFVQNIPCFEIKGGESESPCFCRCPFLKGTPSLGTPFIDNLQNVLLCFGQLWTVGR